VFFSWGRSACELLVDLLLFLDCVVPAQRFLFPALLVFGLPFGEFFSLALFGQALQLCHLFLIPSELTLELLQSLQGTPGGFVAYFELSLANDLFLYQILLAGDLLGPSGHLPNALGVCEFLGLEEGLLFLPHLVRNRLETLELHLQALDSLLRHRALAGKRVAAFQELNILGLDLGDALVVLGTLFSHIGQRAGALVEVLAQVVDRLAQRQEHVAQSLVFGLARAQLFFEPHEPRQVFAKLPEGSGESGPIAAPHPLRFPVCSKTGLGLPVQHNDDFVLELLERLFKLSEAGKLCARARKSSLQFLDTACLLLVFENHALQSLLQLGELVPIMAVFLVQPGHDLAQLCQVHMPLSYCECWSFSSTILPAVTKMTRSPILVARSEKLGVAAQSRYVAQ
jgi:hypothetical protein